MCLQGERKEGKDGNKRWELGPFQCESNRALWDTKIIVLFWLHELNDYIRKCKTVKCTTLGMNSVRFKDVKGTSTLTEHSRKWHQTPHYNYKKWGFKVFCFMFSTDWLCFLYLVNEQIKINLRKWSEFPK